ncbi:MAG: hypothetical protein WD645_01890 [Dehalococcoidia bacterium]
MLVLDADALIKLNRVGVLDHLSQTFPCIIPPAVHFEAIERARERGHEDAGGIEATVDQLIPTRQPARSTAPEPGLGSGDLELIGLALDRPDAVVVSDDRRLLASLSRSGRPFITTAAAVAALAGRNVLDPQDARSVLDKLRPYITRAAYEQAIDIIEETEAPQ